ncbi:MAG: glycosyl-4,4'-diaponeurosporenoate acyltransferase [Oscillospiraceae bacterium]|nr:glycosyl-4,4'-diaponeurosporenoate acyltransferase [Oscillospiraceae bacterium]
MRLLGCIVYIAVLGLGSHYLGEALPRDRFDPGSFPYSEFWWEKSGRVYKLLRVKKWKNKMPDASRYFKDMVPKRIIGMTSSENIEVLVKETCVAEFTHYLLCVLSGGVCFIWKDGGGAVIWIISIVCNLVFVIIQRYNRPHLIKLADKLKIREERLKVCAY